MEHKKSIFWIGGAALMVIVAIFVVHAMRTGWLTASGSPSKQYSPTWTSAPANIVVSNEGDSSTLTGVATPSEQVAAAPSSAASFRDFSISIVANAYKPATINVYQGDTVNIELTAVDGNYDFTQPDYGLSSTIKKGQTKTIQFQALQPGSFTFFCSSCGGPSKGPVGHIDVAVR